MAKSSGSSSQTTSHSDLSLWEEKLKAKPYAHFSAAANYYVAGFHILLYNSWLLLALLSNSWLLLAPITPNSRLPHASSLINLPVMQTHISILLSVLPLAAVIPQWSITSS